VCVCACVCVCMCANVCVCVYVCTAKTPADKRMWQRAIKTAISMDQTIGMDVCVCMYEYTYINV